MNPQLVIFDLDGTLVDSVPDLAAAIDKTLSDLGYPIAGEDKVRCWVGNGAAMLVKRALGDAGIRSDEKTLEATLRTFKLHYGAGSSSRTRLYAGVLPCLESLARQQVTMAIVTNKPREFVPAILSALSIDHFFSLIIGGDDLPERKPSPLPLEYCMKQFGFSAAETVMVGDSIHDIAAAKTAGIPIIAVDYGYNHGNPIDEAEPDLVVSSLESVFV